MKKNATSSIMSVTANKKFWAEFIDIYHSLPSLWNTKDENYNNRDCRTFAWNKLVQKMREVEPDANQDSVKRKINTYRSNFNREMRKIRQSQRDQPGEVYNPTLWYFDHLSFLLSQEKSNNTSMDDQSHDEEMTLMNFNSTKSEIKEEENLTLSAPASLNQTEISTVEEQQNQHCENSSQFTTRLVLKKHRAPQAETNHMREYLVPTIEVLTNESATLNPTARFQSSSPVAEMPQEHSEPAQETLASVKPTTTRKLRLLPNKRSKQRLKSQEPYLRNSMVSSALNDEAAIYGQSWACGFRKLSPQQKLFAKKAIDEILILGQLEALKFNTVSMNGNFMESTNNEED